MSAITFRSGPEVDKALDELAADHDEDRSAAIRRAILDSWRLHRADRLRKQAEALASDPDDLAEIRAVREDLDAIRAW
ncbi:MAG: ribbon-helix-helix protein, CopG family [Thermocrispum sp.]